jgi:hypothetical protein
LLGNRFLLGISKKEIGLKAYERIIDICERMGMPGDLLAAFKQRLDEANYVHFGFEENETTCLYKAYLEFGGKIEEELKSSQNASKPFLLHLGFKWDAFNNTKQSITHYTWYPWLSAPDILARLSNILDPQRHRNSFEIAENIVKLASERILHRDILYLEVTEENNPRTSFDINIYRASLQVGELYPLLSRMGQYYSISPEKFHGLYDRVKDKTFGHLSGGIDREGKDFLTVYYGVESFREEGAKTGLPADDAPPAAGADRTTPGKNPFFIGVETRDAKAGKLLELVKRLNVPVGLEHSFKVLEKTLLPDRFLLGFNRNAVRQKPNESILDICRKIEMPEDFLEIFRKNLPKANVVLFGFEGTEKSRLYKAYLEFGGGFEKIFKENPDKPEPFLIHLGFKWDVSAASQKTVARYTCFPLLNAKDMLGRLSSDHFFGKKRKPPLEIVERIVNLAGCRVDPCEFLYFEAKEDDNPRTSFDINMYRANLRMKELYPFLLEMVRYYSVPAEQFHNLYATVKNRIFGHLTGGTDRAGRDFLTLYYGEKGSSGPPAAN